jgi:hypothetical protein
MSDRMTKTERRALEVRAFLCQQEKPVTYAAIRIASLEEEVSRLRDQLQRSMQEGLPKRRIVQAH